jgi:hypothetical protein
MYVTEALHTKMSECSPPSHTYYTYNTTYSKSLPPPPRHNSPSWARASSLPWLHDHTPAGLLAGQPALRHVTSWLNNLFCLNTIHKSLTKSLPERLQVNAPKSSHNSFMTGHSTQVPERCSHMAITVLSRWCTNKRNHQVVPAPAYPL